MYENTNASELTEVGLGAVSELAEKKMGLDEIGGAAGLEDRELSREPKSATAVNLH